MNNPFTGTARIFYTNHLQEKVKDYQQAMVLLEEQFHNETTQERIAATLESLHFSDFVSPDTPLNNSFVKLTACIDKLFPRTPQPYPTEYNKRVLLSNAISKQDWASATLIRTTAELPRCADLAAFLASVLQKLAARHTQTWADITKTNEAFYASPRYGRNSGYRKDRSCRNRCNNQYPLNDNTSRDRDYNRRMKNNSGRNSYPRRMYCVKRHHNSRNDRENNMYYILEDNLELMAQANISAVVVKLNNLPRGEPRTVWWRRKKTFFVGGCCTHRNAAPGRGTGY